MCRDEIIKKWYEEKHRADYIDSNYCDNIEVSLIKDTIEVLINQAQEIKNLQEKIERIIKIIKDVNAETVGFFGNEFVKDILFQVYDIDEEG